MSSCLPLRGFMRLPVVFSLAAAATAAAATAAAANAAAATAADAAAAIAAAATAAAGCQVGDGEGDELEALGGERVTFTQVSSAIEGASKVYGYRVEAVYDQTYHLLNGLAASKSGGSHAPDDQDEQQQQLRRRQRQQQQRLLQFAHGSESTLADAKDITCEQLEMGVVVDPFFVKMAGLFDQAGAKGLLLSNLQADESLSLRFDGEAPAFPAATAASTAAAAADACVLDCAVLADLVLAGAPNRPIETSICSEAIAHFSQQIEALKGAADGEPLAGEEGDAARGAEEAGGGDSQGEEGTDELLAGFEGEAAAEDAANDWERQHEQQQQQQQWQDGTLEQPQEQQHHLDDEAGMQVDFAADEFGGHFQDLGAPDRMHSLLAGTSEASGREGLRDLENLLSASFLSSEGLGFKRRPAKDATRRFAAAADEAAAAAAAAAAGKSQQLLAALDPFLVDMTNLHKQMPVQPLLKAERCMPPAPKPVDSIFVASDMTSSPFAPSPQQLLSLSLLAAKQLQLSGGGCQRAALVDVVAADAGRAGLPRQGLGLRVKVTAAATCAAAAAAAFVSRLFDSQGLGEEPRLLALAGAPQKVAVSDLRLSLPSRYVDVAVVKRTLRRALRIESQVDSREKAEEKAEGDTRAENSDVRTPHATTSLLPAVERRNCSPQMLFVCLLYTANDAMCSHIGGCVRLCPRLHAALFLSPSTARKTFVVRCKAPLFDQLADDQQAEAALQAVASYAPLDLTQFAQDKQILPLPPLPKPAQQQQQLQQQEVELQQQQQNKKRRRSPSSEAPAAAAAPERLKKGLSKKPQQQQQQRKREAAAAAASKRGPKRLRQSMRKQVSSSCSSSSSEAASEEEVFT
ncbi:hypothetical protein Efla_007331 [Eimeria flavescens]